MAAEALPSVGTTVILAAQSRVRSLKQELHTEEVRVEEAELAVRTAMAAREYKYRELCELLDFLVKFNPDAFDDWYAEVGVEEPSIAQREAWEAD